MNNYTQRRLEEFDKQFVYSVLLGSTLNDGSVQRFKFGESADRKNIKDFLSTSIQEAEQEMNNLINEKVADERDKAEKHYQEEQDDYSQGYYMAMNTMMKFLASLPLPTNPKD